MQNILRSRCRILALGLLLSVNSAALATELCSEHLLPAFGVSRNSWLRTDFFHQVSESVDLKQHASDEYGWLNSRRILNSFRRLGAQYTVLVADPGLVLHLEEFIDFANQHRTFTQNPWEMRDLFRKGLGKRTVYRAITLPSEDAARSILENGMDSGLFRQAASSSAQLDELIKSRARKGVPGEIRGSIIQRPTDGIVPRFSLSVSDHPEIAVGVADVFGKKTEDVYLFAVEIDALDIIELGGKYRYPFMIRLACRLGLCTGVKFSDGKENNYRYGPEVESFVLFRILPQEISAVYKVPRDAAFKYRTGLNLPTQFQKSAEEFLGGLNRFN